MSDAARHLGAPPEASLPAAAAAGDEPWNIEIHGIDAIPEEKRHGSSLELFWIWFAANIGILAVTYGAFLIVFYGLNLWQAVVAGVVGVVLSFLLVGVISLAGKRGGAPTLILSRASFGVHGNGLPTLVSYVSLVGWEIVLTSLATLAAQTVLARFHMHTDNFTMAIAFVIIAALAILISLLGHATIVKVQTWFTLAFGLLTAVFIGLEMSKVDWHRVAALPRGSFFAGMIGGFSIIFIGTGLTWANTAADYSRYLPRRASSRSIISWTLLGASLPLVILIIFGSLLAANDTTIATSSNPIGVLAAPLPTWFLVPYMITAVGGLVAEVLMSSYSGGLNLLTLGIRIPRYKSIIFDSVFLIGGSIYILFFAPSFFAPFEGFLETIGVLLAAWAAIFLIDMWMYRQRGYDESALYRSESSYGSVGFAAVVAFVVASVAGLGAVTSTSAVFKWAGYFLRFMGGRTGAVGSSDMGLIFAFVISGVLYLALSVLTPQRLRGRPLATVTEVHSSAGAAIGRGDELGEAETSGRA